MAAPIPASLLTANRSLNNPAAVQVFHALTANLIAQISAGTIKDYHQISKWRTPQDKSGFERNTNATWLEVLDQLAICMKHVLSRPTVLLYISTGAGIKYTLTLTNTLRLVHFEMEDITNCPTLSAPTADSLNKKGGFYVPSKQRPVTNVSVPHISPLSVKDVAHLLTSERFPNELHKQGMVPTLTKDTRHWLSFAATQSIASTTSSRLSVMIVGKLELGMNYTSWWKHVGASLPQQVRRPQAKTRKQFNLT